MLVVDDHPDFRAAASALLAAEGFEVVGVAASGQEAVVVISALQPDVVLLDIRLPDLDGFAVAAQIAELADPPAVVLVSSRGAGTYGPRLGRAAAVGFMAKSELSGAALRRLLDGSPRAPA
ncbi:response regulator receiver domain-containing protein [Kribbella antiqua]|uniref:Response regulator receiver domain-containing protein n=1 Tax=Kribbella antiqua TaxID=2512217 RepID=A0A4R2J273_9ACTN|nr:response regulator receiver domain-containing protein [Kribbella antiqua]